MFVKIPDCEVSQAYALILIPNRPAQVTLGKSLDLLKSHFPHQ